MGELQFEKNRVFIPERVPDRKLHNLALENLTLLVMFEYDGEELIGRLDTDANKSIFYQPFYERFFSSSVKPSEFDTIKSAGVGGMVEHEVYKADIYISGIGISGIGPWQNVDNKYFICK